MLYKSNNISKKNVWEWKALSKSNKKKVSKSTTSKLHPGASTNVYNMINPVTYLDHNSSRECRSIALSFVKIQIDSVREHELRARIKYFLFWKTLIWVDML